MKKKYLMRSLRLGLAAAVFYLPAYTGAGIAEAALPEAGESAIRAGMIYIEPPRRSTQPSAKSDTELVDEYEAQEKANAEASAPGIEAELEEKVAPEEETIPIAVSESQPMPDEEGAEAPAPPDAEEARGFVVMQDTEGALPRQEQNLAPYVGRTITRQTVSGNDSVAEAEILAALKPKPGMQFTEAGLSDDLNAIYDMGYFYDMRPEFTLVPEGVQVNYHVMENPIFTGLAVEGNTVLPEAKINSIFDLEQSKIANLKEVNSRVQRLEEEYRQQGYILARVTGVHMAQDGTLHITVSEGIVEGFKVRGNKKCKDYVITREMRLKQGKPFNAKDARRSMQRIYNLGYFEDVNVKLNPGREENGIEVEISVVEMNSGTFGIGAGYSNADGFIGMISIGDKNFRGIGDSVNIRWEFGGEDDKNYDFTYTRPWIDKKETQASINLYDITNEYADYDNGGHEIARYDKKRRGQELTFSRKTSNEFISNYVTLKNRDDLYRGEADGYEGRSNQYYEDQFNESNKRWKDWYPKTAAERRKENFGSTRSITIGRVYDNRDNMYDPHEGKRIGYSIEWAGMGGDFSFTKFTADYRYYFRAGGQSIWALNLVAGYADGNMPLSQRFTMGGSETLRGYEDDQFRGNSLLKATLEYRFPIVKKVQGVIFSDNGYAWDKRHEDAFDLSLIKNSYGVGLRMNSPIGPLRVDYGYNGHGGKFHFSFAGQF